MKKITTSIISIAFAMLNCGLLNAQTPKVTTQWETALNKNLQKGNVYDNYLGEDDKSYFILVKKLGKQLTYNYGVEKYDKKTLNPTGTKYLEDLGNVEAMYIFGNETYARIYENPQKAFKAAQAPVHKLHKFNKEKMIFEPVKELANTNLKNLSAIEISPDESKILLVFSERVKGKNENHYNSNFFVVDNKFNKLWEKTSPTSNVVSHAVSNDGTAYIACISSSDDKQDTELPDLIIQKISNNSEKSFVVNMNNYLYQEIKLLLNKDNKLLAIGFFTDKVDESKTGSYYFSMSANFDKAENISYNEIPLNILNTHKGAAKLENRYGGYEFGNVLYGENGEIAICVEETTNRRHTTYYNKGVQVKYSFESSASSSTTTTYHYDIYVFKINNEQLSWVKRVPKKQKATDTNAIAYENHPRRADKLSYEAFLSGDKVVLLFMDVTKGENMNANEFTEKSPLAYGKDCGFVSLIIDKDGKQKRQIVDTSTLSKEKLDIEMQKCFRITNNLAIVSARKDAICKIGLISIGK